MAFALLLLKSPPMAARPPPLPRRLFYFPIRQKYYKIKTVKCIFKQIFIFIILIYSLPLWASKNLHIMIDPGHGGSDLGATKGPLIESEIVFMIAKELYSELENISGIRVSLTRTQIDESLSLFDRLSIAEENNADLFVSLHLNSAPDSRARGIELFTRKMYEFQKPKPQLDSQTDLERVVQDLEQLGRDRSSLVLKTKFYEHLNSVAHRILIKQAPFYVLEQSKTPAILVELGFLTNTRDAQLLSQKEYRKSLVSQIAKAVTSYKNSDLPIDQQITGPALPSPPGKNP